jgi:hypothetical protein
MHLDLAPGAINLLPKLDLISLRKLLGRPAWDFYQIHPSNFHCVEDGHHGYATPDLTEFD